MKLIIINKIVSNFVAHDNGLGFQLNNEMDLNVFYSFKYFKLDDSKDIKPSQSVFEVVFLLWPEKKCVALSSISFGINFVF